MSNQFERDQADDKRDRVIREAVRTAPIIEPPPDFARMMERRVQDLPEQAGVEIWLQRLALALAALVLIAFAEPLMTGALDRVGSRLDGAPWAMLFVAAVTMGAIWIADRPKRWDWNTAAPKGRH